MFISGHIQFEISENAHSYIHFILLEQALQKENYLLKSNSLTFHPGYTSGGNLRSALDSLLAFIKKNGKIINLEQLYVKQGPYLGWYEWVNGHIFYHFKLERSLLEIKISTFQFVKYLMLEELLYVEGVHSLVSLKKRWHWIRQLLRKKNASKLIRIVTKDACYTYDGTQWTRTPITFFSGVHPARISEISFLIINTEEKRMIEIDDVRYSLTKLAVQQEPKALVYLGNETTPIGDGCSQCKFRTRNVTSGCTHCNPTFFNDPYPQD